MPLVFDISFHEVELWDCAGMSDSLLDVFESLRESFKAVAIVLGKQVKTPKVFRRREELCSIWIILFFK